MTNKKSLNKEIKKMNKNTEKPLKVKFCPQCRSTDVGFVFRMQNLFGLLPKIECTKCGHRNVIFPILVIKPSDLKKKAKKVTKKKRSKK